MPSLKDQLTALKMSRDEKCRFIRQCLLTDVEGKAPVTRFAQQELQTLDKRIEALEQKIGHGEG